MEPAITDNHPSRTGSAGHVRWWRGSGVRRV